MHNGSSKVDRDFTVNGSVTTLQRQQRSKTLNRQDRGSCSSTVSCPVFSAQRGDPEEHSPSRCPSSLSFLSLQGSLTRQYGSESIPSNKNVTVIIKNSKSSLQGSLPSLEPSVSNLKNFSTPFALQSSNLSLHSSSTSFCSSSSSVQSGSSSENDSWDTNSWSSGATCLLRSSIKQHSEEVFRVRATSGNRPEPASDSETGYHHLKSSLGNERQPESQKASEKTLLGRKDSVQSQTSSHCSTVASAASADLEKQIEAKLKFSQFLDEVTCRVLNPESLHAFGAVHQKEALVPSAPSSLVNSSNLSSITSPTARDYSKNNIGSSVFKWNKCTPSCKIMNTNETAEQEEKPLMDPPTKTYLETNIDSIWKEDDINSVVGRDGKRGHLSEMESEKRKFSQSKQIFGANKCPNPSPNLSTSSATKSYFSTSLPRPFTSSLATERDTRGMSSTQEQKEDLQKHLSYTTHKLEMLESEFDSTRQYLEMELRRVQEELEKFTDNLCRIQSNYAALQKINQDLEDKIHCTTQQYEEEKRTMSQQITALNKHLKESKITIEKLKEDNELYRKDCNLAAQLLQCGKSHYRGHKMSELPTDFRERVNSHIEKHGNARSMGLCHAPYSDVVPTAVIAKVLEKPEPGSTSTVTHSSSSQSHDTDFLQTNSGTDTADMFNHSVFLKSSDLYCSDTALYCPMDDRRQNCWQERRQSVDLHGSETAPFQGQNSKLEQQNFYSSFSHNADFQEFGVSSHPASSSYTILSTASDKKVHDLSSTLSTPQPLYMDWQEVNYERRNTTSYDKNRHTGNPPAYTQMASGYSETYHSPQLMSSNSMISGVRRKTRSSNVLPYNSSGHVPPYRFSQQHMNSDKIKMDPLHSRFQEETFHTHMLDPCLPTLPCTSLKQSPKQSVGISKTKNEPKHQLKVYGQQSRNRTIHPERLLDKVNSAGNMNIECTHVKINNSAETLHQKSLEASNVNHYQLHTPRQQRKTPLQQQKFGSAGLTRKDSLTKAQLYGTLLN